MQHLIGSFFFQAEDGIRDCLLSRGLGDVYKRQPRDRPTQQSFRQLNIELWGEGTFILQNPVSAISALHLFEHT